MIVSYFLLKNFYICKNILNMKVNFKDLKTVKIKLGQVFLTNKGLVKFIKVTPKGYNFLILDENKTLLEKRHVYMHKEKEDCFVVHKFIADGFLKANINLNNYKNVIEFVIQKLTKISWYLEFDNRTDTIYYNEKLNIFNGDFGYIQNIVSQINKEFSLGIIIKTRKV